MNLTNQSILSVDQFGRDDIEYLFKQANQMKRLVKTNGGSDLLKHKVLSCLFYESSTRTSSSFIAAMQRLGGSVIPITQGVQYSSVSKGESLPDTVKTLERYSDAIVLRHPDIGSAKLASEAIITPIINAGDGAGEHPTQALLDIFTIYSELGQVDNLNVVLVGDLRYGRTVHSLALLLNNFDGIELGLVSPSNLIMPNHIKRSLVHSTFETQDLETILPYADVIYMTRVQKERFTDVEEYMAVKDDYIITPDLLTNAKDDMIVMHPLPRVNEISRAVDSDPRAAYFRQVENGLYMRMALLAGVLGKL